MLRVNRHEECGPCFDKAVKWLPPGGQQRGEPAPARIVAVPRGPAWARPGATVFHRRRRRAQRIIRTMVCRELFQPRATTSRSRRWRTPEGSVEAAHHPWQVVPAWKTRQRVKRADRYLELGEQTLDSPPGVSERHQCPPARPGVRSVRKGLATSWQAQGRRLRVVRHAPPPCTGRSFA